MDIIDAVPPFYYKKTEDLVINYFLDLIESVKTPVFAYNNPEMSRFYFTLKTIQRLQGFGLKVINGSSLELVLSAELFMMQN